MALNFSRLVSKNLENSFRAKYALTPRKYALTAPKICTNFPKRILKNIVTRILNNFRIYGTPPSPGVYNDANFCLSIMGGGGLTRAFLKPEARMLLLMPPRPRHTVTRTHTSSSAAQVADAIALLSSTPPHPLYFPATPTMHLRLKAPGHSRQRSHWEPGCHFWETWLLGTPRPVFTPMCV